MQCPGMTLENVEHLDFDDRKLMSHGRIVMEALGAAVECLNDSDQLSVLLIGQFSLLLFALNSMCTFKLITT